MKDGAGDKQTMSQEVEKWMKEMAQESRNLDSVCPWLDSEQSSSDPYLFLHPC